MSWGGRDTSSVLRDGTRKSTKLSSLSVRVGENPRLKFTSLAYFITVDFLERAFRELKKDRASGVDGVTVKDYEANLEENLKDLVKRLKAKRYRPQPVRRVYIPKPKGGRRPLGIPTVEDKIVQMALKKILEAIFVEVSPKLYLKIQVSQNNSPIPLTGMLYSSLYRSFRLNTFKFWGNS